LQSEPVLPRARSQCAQGQAEAILSLIHAGRDIIENDELDHWR
jgi:hypothetical protein